MSTRKNEWRMNEDVLLQNPLLPLREQSRVLEVPVFREGVGLGCVGASRSGRRAGVMGHSCCCTGCSPRARTERTPITSPRHSL